MGKPRVSQDSATRQSWIDPMGEQVVLKKKYFGWLAGFSLVAGSLSGWTSAAQAVDGCFTDVPGSAAFALDICTLKNLGVFRGHPDGSFRPEAPVTRAAMISFIYRMAGSPQFTPQQQTFNDVAPDNQFYNEIEWAAAQGMTQGWSDGTFRPWQPVARDAVATFLYRQAGSPEIDTSQQLFYDVAPDNQFYRGISWMGSSGISTGWPDGTYHPLEQTSRNAMAAFLARVEYGGVPVQLPVPRPDRIPDSELLTTDFAQKANLALANAGGPHNLPLILQKDQRWANLHYGINGNESDMGHAGCAIASLSMINAYWGQDDGTPLRVLNWAGDRFYVPGQGTSWQIFSSFAQDFGYGFQNLGNSFALAQQKMAEGLPVIVSVRRGTFTTGGHIMVLTAADNGRVRVYDPNDSPEKRHYEQTFGPEVFQNEALSYWTFWR